MKTTIIILSFIFTSSLLHSQVRIKMEKVGSVYETPCTVNGLKLLFVFDTGSSNVAISLIDAVFMLKNGYLDKADLKGSSYSQLANGEIVKNTTAILRSLTIGGITLHNVTAIIMHNLSAPLLLGQSAIQRLGKIQLEGDELVILKGNTTSDYNACITAMGLMENAFKYYEDRLYSLAANTYQKAYDLCPETFTTLNINDASYYMANAYYLSNQNNQAIKYLRIAAKNENRILVKNKNDSSKLYIIYSNLGRSFCSVKQYNNGILSVEMALTYATKDDDKQYCYFLLGFITSGQKNYSRANEFYKNAMDYLLKAINFTMDDVIAGKVNNGALGELFYDMAHNFVMLDETNVSKRYMSLSADCGYEPAIEQCNRFGIRFLAKQVKKY